MTKRAPTSPKEKSTLHIYLEGLFLICSGIALGMSLVHSPWLGLLGSFLSSTSFYLFGAAGFLIPLFLVIQGIRFIRRKAHRWTDWALTASLLFSASLLLAQVGTHFPLLKALGGRPFYYLYREASLRHFLGVVGTTIVFSLLCFASVVLLIRFDFRRLVTLWHRLHATPPEPIEAVATVDEPPSLARPHPLREPKERPEPVKAKPPKSLPKPPPETSRGGYTIPPTTLLTQVKNDPGAQKGDLKRQAETLEETLKSFGIEAKVGQITCGPTITSFEVHPAVGVKVQKIKALENDLALNMQAKSIRIVAPIPGKAAVGIEIPNSYPQEVSFRELIEGYLGGQKKVHIPLILGKGVSGDEVVGDLTKMPHMIIAGATGSGKSVCINTIVMSILMNATPDEIKLVMVDPKKVELTAYSTLPHMLAPVITEAKEALAALHYLVREMEKRYELLRLLGCRNIHAFNSRTINPDFEGSLEQEVPAHLPYIVVIIDELADLMMVSSSDIETPIARIAQMARAVGIHLILATQRPSREVITGLIKANFPTRLAFKVSSRVNSQIIIDENGAETLLGNGDMLFIPPGTASLVRAQGAFIRDEDINRVIEFIGKQRGPSYIIPSFADYAVPDTTAQGPTGDADALYDEAKSIVLETGNASTTFLQRKLKIGYARAASLMDQLEGNGIIGPAEGARPRKIFYPKERE